VSDKPYFLYILWSDCAERFYVGINEDVAHRIEQHNAGLSQWTAKFGPWRPVHAERSANYTEARKREIQLKRQKGGNGFYTLIGRTFENLTGATDPSGA